jgi:hypothetical protein
VEVKLQVFLLTVFGERQYEASSSDRFIHENIAVGMDQTGELTGITALPGVTVKKKAFTTCKASAVRQLNNFNRHYHHHGG